MIFNLFVLEIALNGVLIEVMFVVIIADNALLHLNCLLFMFCFIVGTII